MEAVLTLPPASWGALGSGEGRWLPWEKMKQSKVTVIGVGVVQGTRWTWGPEADIALDQRFLLRTWDNV